MQLKIQYTVLKVSDKTVAVLTRLTHDRIHDGNRPITACCFWQPAWCHQEAITRNIHVKKQRRHKQCVVSGGININKKNTMDPSSCINVTIGWVSPVAQLSLCLIWNVVSALSSYYLTSTLRYNIINKTEENRGLHQMQHQFIVNSGECSHHSLYQPVEGDKIPAGAHKYIKIMPLFTKWRWMRLCSVLNRLFCIMFRVVANCRSCAEFSDFTAKKKKKNMLFFEMIC